MRGILLNKKQLAMTPLKMFLGLGLFMIGVVLANRWWSAPASPALANPVVNIGTPALTAQASAPATSTPSPTPSVTLLPNRITITPPSQGRVITLTTTANVIGWASDLDGRSHFNTPVIHAGFY